MLLPERDPVPCSGISPVPRMVFTRSTEEYMRQPAQPCRPRRASDADLRPRLCTEKCAASPKAIAYARKVFCRQCRLILVVGDKLPNPLARPLAFVPHVA